MTTMTTTTTTIVTTMAMTTATTTTIVTTIMRTTTTTTIMGDDNNYNYADSNVNVVFVGDVFARLLVIKFVFTCNLQTTFLLLSSAIF